MSSSICYFLTCIQISQEAGDVVWYSHLLKNIPQFVVIHTVRGGVVNNTKEDIFLELSYFFWWSNRYRQLDLWLPFLKPAWTSGSSWFTYCGSLAWRILSGTLPAWEMSATKPMGHDYGAQAAGPRSHSYGAHVLQHWSLCAWEPVLSSESHHDGWPRHCN